MTAWTDPRHDGAGTWAPTRPHENGLTDVLVSFLACLLAGVLFLGLLVAGRALVCAANDNHGHPTVSYCPGYEAAE